MFSDLGITLITNLAILFYLFEGIELILNYIKKVILKNIQDYPISFSTSNKYLSNVSISLNRLNNIWRQQHQAANWAR